jgi:hypothetical protein
MTGGPLRENRRRRASSSAWTGEAPRSYLSGPLRPSAANWVDLRCAHDNLRGESRYAFRRVLGDVPRGIESHKLVRYTRVKSEPLADLLSAIDNSRSMLDLPDDWDDEGSPRIMEETWRRATDYLRRHAHLLYELNGSHIPIPRILPGPEGSVDLHWKTGRRELLANVPAAADQPATFYGDAFGTNSIKGRLDTEADDLGLFTWLTAMQ